MEIYVELKGDESILKELTGIIKKEEHSFEIIKNENAYILKSGRFKQMNDSEIKEEANRIISKLNKTLKITFEPIRLISIGSIIKDENGKKYTTSSDIQVSISLKPNSTIKITNKEGNILKIYLHDLIKELPNLIEINENLSKALELYNPNSIEPYQYFKVFEIIRKELGGEDNFAKIIGIDKKEISRFKNSCNNPEAIGFDKARHSIPKGCSPKNPMTLNEIKEFTKTSLIKWILKIKKDTETEK